jgi:RNA polymerase I-specific transcription initiation factor RRN6
LQLLPFKQCFGPSIHKTLEDKEKASISPQSQLKWLSKARPETFPGSIVISSFAKAPSARLERSSYEGPLLAIGRAVNPDRVSASHPPQILAMSCGGAGHILRLIRPRTESRGWGKQSGATLSILDPNSPEVGYWLGDGGTILQIVSADEEHGPGTWFAVRQTTVITIFRPVYGRLHNPAVHPNDDPRLFLPSRLNPNPVAVLRTERANSLGYVDFSFNPWYARQFAVVDPTGFWSIWDIEKPLGKGSSEVLLPGRTGQVYAVPDPALKVSINDHADGWYRVLWACNVSTIVVCNRRFLSVFDVKGIPTRLKSTETLTGSGPDWILDIKRSAVNMNSLFVLTTSRVFWVEVIPLSEEKEDQNVSAGARVILSYRHFRDPNDETLKLTPIKDNNGMKRPVTYIAWLIFVVSVILTSAQTPEASVHSFWTSTDAYGTPMSSQAPLHLLPVLDYEAGSQSLSLHTLCFLNSPLTSRSSQDASGPELQYLEQDVKFFQLWALTSNLGLGSALFSIYSPPPDGHMPPIPLILPPSVRLGSSTRRMGSKYVDHPFIVPDGTDEEAILDEPYKKPELEQDLTRKSKAQDDLRLRLNWRKIFQHVFLQGFPTGQDIDHDVNSMPKLPKMLELLGRASDRIDQGLGENVLAASTM